MGRNLNLIQAKTTKKDEFYTQLSDVEQEVLCYREQFFGASVYCNCDDPLHSAFWEFFFSHFSELRLKKLTATFYTPGNEKSEVFVFDGKEIQNRIIRGDGSFSSSPCLDILDECDVVCTNPPFSLFSDFINLLLNRKKKFLIIGNLNAVLYRSVFPQLQKEAFRFGYHNGCKTFLLPTEYEDRGIVSEDGRRYIQMGNTVWYTNLSVRKTSYFVPSARFADRSYIRYENFPAIHIGRLRDIPCDYEGIMGVPITFLTDMDIHQYELVGSTADVAAMSPDAKLGNAFMEMLHRQGGTGHYSAGMYAVYYKKDGKVKVPFGRLFIRKKDMYEVGKEQNT